MLFPLFLLLSVSFMKLIKDRGLYFHVSSPFKNKHLFSIYRYKSPIIYLLLKGITLPSVAPFRMPKIQEFTSFFHSICTLRCIPILHPHTNNISEILVETYMWKNYGKVDHIFEHKSSVSGLRFQKQTVFCVIL